MTTDAVYGTTYGTTQGTTTNSTRRSRMKERGILMSAPMVRATLDDVKTHTRRIITPQDHLSGYASLRCDWILHGVEPGDNKFGIVTEQGDHTCPYGGPGDRLYVKENFALPKELDRHSPRAVGEMALDAHYRSPWSPVHYHATDSQRDWDKDTWGETIGRHRVGRFMPKWLSRITLEIVRVWVERIQDISDEDIVAEGIYEKMSTPHRRKVNGEWSDQFACFDKRLGMMLSWNDLHGVSAWDRNDWVWCIEFTRVRHEH